VSVDLHDLAAPPARPRFRDELWERAEAAERRSARRWRATAFAAIAGAVATTTAAGVLAVRSTPAFTGTYDQTKSCAVPIQGGIPVVHLLAHSTYATTMSGTLYHFPSVVALSDANGESLGGMSQGRRSWGFGSDACTTAGRVALGHGRLPLVGTFVAGDPGLGSTGEDAACFVGGHVRVRVQAVVRNDKPVSGQVTMWTGGKHLRQVLSVDWAPKRIAVYMSDDCHG
jgi:hypothetical protein